MEPITTTLRPLSAIVRTDKNNVHCEFCKNNGNSCTSIIGFVTLLNLSFVYRTDTKNDN